MIYGEFLSGQGLGNQLWNYAALRSIAENYGRDYYFFGADKFKGNDFLSFPMTSLSNEEVIDLGIPEIKNIFNESLFYDKSLGYYSSGFDDGVNRLPNNVHCSGLFQSEKYFFGNISRIKKYIELNPVVLSEHALGPNVCVINIRGGEYKRHKKFILPYSYWENAISEMIRRFGNLEFIVVTDDPMYAKELFPKLKVISGSIQACYSAIYSAKYVIVSNSTFSYFPIKTSFIKKSVIAPKYWARHTDRLKLWASPANLYSEWLWADTNGTISSYEDCVTECDELEAEYIRTCTVKVPMDILKPFSFKQFIPKAMIPKLKKLLSVLFPKHIG